MFKIIKILNSFFAIFLILLIPISSSGILVFKHICNSTDTERIYFYFNEKCENDNADSCCTEDLSAEKEQSCCEKSYNECELSKNESETQKIIKSSKCCFDESYVFSINSDILNKDKITKIFYLSLIIINHDEKLISEPGNLYLSESRFFNISPPKSKIISFIHTISSELSTEDHLS